MSGLGTNVLKWGMVMVPKDNPLKYWEMYVVLKNANTETMRPLIAKHNSYLLQSFLPEYMKLQILEVENSFHLHDFFYLPSLSTILLLAYGKIIPTTETMVKHPRLQKTESMGKHPPLQTLNLLGNVLLREHCLNLWGNTLICKH